MRLRLVVLMAACFLLMYAGYNPLAAQNIVTCPSLVQHAIESVGNNCGSLDRNSACYGFQNVAATFSRAQPVGFFSQPSDRARLLELQDLNTSALDTTNNHWGIALLSMQANLPDTLPGQNVVLMLLGDTQIENAVPADQAFQAGATLDVTLTIGANLYFTPDFNDQVVGNAPQGAVLTADAISPDGQWVRVAYNGTPGWVTQQVITTGGDLKTLPVYGANANTPMQAFYFRTGITGTGCTEAPNALVVQGPQNLTVNIQANGANIRLGSTIALYSLPVDGMTQDYLAQHYGNIGMVTRLMQIVVLDGHVVLNANTPNQMELKTGETTFRCLSDPQNLGDDGQANDRQVTNSCPWAPSRPVTLDDIEQFRALEGVSLNYPIKLPLELPTETPMPSNTPRPTQFYLPVIPTDTPTPTDTLVPQQPPPQQPQQPPPAQPTATFTALPTLTPTPTPTATATVACDGFVFPVNIADGDSANLIAAINSANDEACHPGTDRINLAPNGNYILTAIDNNTDGPNVLPAITSGIIIDGQQSNVVGEVAGAHRLFHVNPSGNLLLGRITVNGGSVAPDNGGGIYNAGKLSMILVTVLSNVAQNGGGLYNLGTATIDKSTFDSNTAQNGGGGIYNSGTLTTLNSTITNNNGSIDGAALQNAGGSSVLNFTTVYGNISTGGGIEITGGTVTSKNSIVAQTAVGGNCIGAITAVGTNFADDATCSGFTNSSTLNINPAAAQNGGYTSSHALGGGSAAIDSSDCTTTTGTAVNEDQRGQPATIIRPANGNGMPDPGECDAGSYEYQP